MGKGCTSGVGGVLWVKSRPRHSISGNLIIVESKHNLISSISAVFPSVLSFCQVSLMPSF